MLCRPACCAAAAIVLCAPPAAADHWPLIDVKARLANDGRVTIVETHQVVFRQTGKSIHRDFGRAADQDVRLTAVTRVGPDDVEHPLRAVEAVTGPDEYRYYDRGHIYFSIPALGEEVGLTYRFEYELIGGIAPAWAIGAGPGSRADDLDLHWPWQRARHIVADWRRAWPLRHRYRYDHDVVFPDKGLPDNSFHQIDYRLEYDSQWRDTAPQASVGAAVPSQAYRAAKLFEYLGPGIPLHASAQPAAERLAALAVVPLAGVAGWLLVVFVERRRWRRGPAIDRTFVDRRFLSRSPEELAFWFQDHRPSVEGLLSRLAGEGAIAIQVGRAPGQGTEGRDDELDGTMRLHLRRVAADTALTEFERTVLDDLFGPARELTTASHAARHRGKGYDPADALDARLSHPSRARGGEAGGRPDRTPRWRPARIGLAVVLGSGLFVAFEHAGPVSDMVLVGALPAAALLAVTATWPAGWWHPGRPARGLLVALLPLYALQVAWLLGPNRPLPSPGWTAAALATLAGYFLTLTASRMPAGTGGMLEDLARMRAFAAAELRRPRPQLDDRWIPRLRALGLGAAIDRWRARHGGASASPPEVGEGPRLTSATFTGVGPAPWRGPAGWIESLTVWADDAAEAEDLPHVQ